MEDRAAALVRERGCEVDARYLFLGDALPQSVEGWAGSIPHGILYGGRFNPGSEAENPFLQGEYR